MAEIILVNGYGGATPTSPLEGWLNLDQGRFLVWGRGTFTTSSLTLTITPRMGTSVDSVLLTGASGVMDLQYAIDSTTGVVTVTRTDTTSGAEISFWIVVRG